MSAREKIAKLESLLARVRQRAETAHEARSGSGAYPVPSRTVVPSSTVVEEPTRQTPTTRPEPESVPAVLVAAASPVVSIPPLPETSGWSDPPPESVVEPEPAEATAAPVADDSEVDVEVSTEVVEIDIDEPGLTAVERGFAPAESGAQLVAEQAHEHEEAVHDDLVDDIASAPTSIPPEYVELPPPANEVLEPAPTSSPRPIEDAYAAVEHAYEEESAPRHTPPPESGKQVAAASVRPEALRKSSVPPPDALGDNTLVGVTSPVGGAWREPGISVPPPASARGSRIPPSAAPPTVNLSPDVTRPAVATDANVIQIDGSAAPFAPATFGELLDATLSL